MGILANWGIMSSDLAAFDNKVCLILQDFDAAFSYLFKKSHSIASFLLYNISTTKKGAQNHEAYFAKRTGLLA